MKRKISLFYFLTFLPLFLTACHQEEDNLFATAVITLETGENISITDVQAQAQFTNVNTRQVTTTADCKISNGKCQVSIGLLRGAYEVLIEGVAECQGVQGVQGVLSPQSYESVSSSRAQGVREYRQFRAQSDYVELAGRGVNTAGLNIIFLN